MIDKNHIDVYKNTYPQPELDSNELLARIIAEVHCVYEEKAGLYNEVISAIRKSSECGEDWLRYMLSEDCPYRNVITECIENAILDLYQMANDGS